MEQNYSKFNIKKLFLNMLLKKGKKNNSEHIFKNILINLKKQTRQKPFFIIIKCLNNLLPKIKVISIPNKKRNTKKNKKNNSYFLMFLNLDKQIKKSIFWLIHNNLKNISDSIIETSKNKGKIIQIKKKYYKEIKKLKFNIRF